MVVEDQANRRDEKRPGGRVAPVRSKSQTMLRQIGYDRRQPVITFSCGRFEVDVRARRRCSACQPAAVDPYA